MTRTRLIIRKHKRYEKIRMENAPVVIPAMAANDGGVAEKLLETGLRNDNDNDNRPVAA